jgi:hypothetical protein
MYIKVTGDKIIKYPYTITELLADNPQVSFPENITETLLAEWGVFPVMQVKQPSVGFDSVVAESTPIVVDGKWTQVWEIGNRPTEELNAINEQLRAEAYRNESDPLFFKWQRGEIEKQVWLDKVAEIKARYTGA